MVEIRQDNNEQYINQIVEIHMETFEGFFLTFLGKGFLKTLYRGFLEHPDSDLIVAVDNSEPIGFLAYSKKLSSFYKWLIRHRLLQFAWYSLLAVFRKPKAFLRLLRAFTYPSTSKTDSCFVELSSIGIRKTSKSKGLGSMLIQTLVDKFRDSEFEYIKLETDAVENELANYFYQKNGFELYHTYETPEGRKMNEYRYYL
ncbi:GNAT family N-acetyltransferase [Streptococcus sp. S784/96/1]|uniref:GNAT family N-acetyltransferase n=1 Tax=Streptococcus sp. S784/96/1 TaxID=2653499 RepID=UPI0013874A37|nr:GNAT family N-acetyltransferase [Streptococcus sp. S784/96/1]